MRDYLIAERYASGLSEAVEDLSKLEEVLQSLTDLSDVYNSEHDLRTVLGNPTREIKKRAAVLDSVLTKMESPVQVKRFAQVLLKKGRISLLSSIAEIFATIVDNRLNRVEARVTSAVPLDSDQRQKITESLQVFSGKTVRTTCEVDKNVLGGVIARIGSVVIDGSLRAKLEQLKHTLLSKEM